MPEAHSSVHGGLTEGGENPDDYGNHQEEEDDYAGSARSEDEVHPHQRMTETL